MGITVHYSLKVPTSVAARVPGIVASIADAAKSLRFLDVGAPIHLEGDACNLDHCEDRALGWLLIQAKRRLGESSEVPLEIHAVTTCPGDGCEPANIGLARFADSTWQWSSFCKTHGAAEQQHGGLPHFVACHTRLCKWLRSIEALGVEVEVADEGGYWGVWDAAVLARHLHVGDFALLAATGVALPSRPSRKSDEPPPSPKERFRHAKWGEAVLVSRDGEKLRLRFDDGTERTLLASSVTSADRAR